MPFINSKVSVKTTVKQRQELKDRLGDHLHYSGKKRILADAGPGGRPYHVFPRQQYTADSIHQCEYVWPSGAGGI